MHEHPHLDGGCLLSTMVLCYITLFRWCAIVAFFFLSSPLPSLDLESSHAGVSVCPAVPVQVRLVGDVLCTVWQSVVEDALPPDRRESEEDELETHDDDDDEPDGCHELLVDEVPSRPPIAVRVLRRSARIAARRMAEEQTEEETEEEEEEEEVLGSIVVAGCRRSLRVMGSERRHRHHH